MVTRMCAPPDASAAVQARSTDMGASANSEIRRSAHGITQHDAGRLQICAPFGALFSEQRLDTFESMWSFDRGTVVRQVGPRETRRIWLPGANGPQEFYLKRFGPPRWRDAIRSLLHLGWPIHGARNEWESIWRFMAAGIPTVTPVAFGESGGRSLLVTEALPAKCNLLEYVRHPAFTRNERVLVQVVEIARRMHAAGLHHQDFYLNHMLLCGDDAHPRVHMIDLGRVRLQQPLRERWITKDLSQLDFSARSMSWRTRLRFLRLYLGRPFRPSDRRWIARMASKSRRIAAHTAKHDL